MAYGQNRVLVASSAFTVGYNADRGLVASDTFDSSISGNWTNGPGDWQDWQWVSGGEIDPVNDASYTGMYYTGSTFAGNHYSKITIQAMGSAADYLGPIVRGQSGSSASYALEIAEQENRRRILEFATGPGETTLAEDAGGTGFPTAAGDTLTLECEGTTLRAGDDMDGSDGQMLTTTDNTLSGGSPGIYGWGDSVNVTAWEGGNINAGNWDNPPDPGNANCEPLSFNSGFVEATVLGSHNGMRRNTESFNADQYSKATLITPSTGFQIVHVRHGVGELDSYRGVYQHDGTYYITDWATDTGETILADSVPGTSLSDGDTLTLEAEGTTLRIGADPGGSDAQVTSVTDNTWSSGKPGVGGFSDISLSDTQITAWEGGNIQGAVWPPPESEGTGNKLRVVSSPLRW